MHTAVYSVHYTDAQAGPIAHCLSMGYGWFSRLKYERSLLSRGVISSNTTLHMTVRGTVRRFVAQSHIFNPTIVLTCYRRKYNSKTLSSSFEACYDKTNIFPNANAHSRSLSRSSAFTVYAFYKIPVLGEQQAGLAYGKLSVFPQRASFIADTS